MDTLKLGQIITIEQQRDAVHMAIAPVIAGEPLEPGTHITVLSNGEAVSSNGVDETIGVADPFLRKSIKPGQKFWLFLYPGSITSLRHEWSHPAFGKTEAVGPTKESENWLRNIADQCGVSYDRMMDAVRDDDYINMGENETYKDVLDGVLEDFNKHCSIVLGRTVSTYPFSCSC